MTLRARSFAAAAALLAFTLAGSSALAQTRTLYDRLGGYPAISAVVDDFVKNVAADKRINRFFANANIDRLKARLVEQICQGTGGPCVYTGRDMRSVHAGMGIRGKDFDALVQDLAKSLNKFKVPAREQQQLVAILAPRADAAGSAGRVGKGATHQSRDRARLPERLCPRGHLGVTPGLPMSIKRVGNGETAVAHPTMLAQRALRGRTPHFKTRSTCRISLKATAEWSMPLPADWPSPLTV
jgi:hemoglobin